MDLVCSSLSLPRGFFSQPSGSSSAEIRRRSSTVEHLENAGVWVWSLNVKSSRYTKGLFGWSGRCSLTRLLLFTLISLPQKYFITPPVPGSHLKDRDCACPVSLLSNHLCQLDKTTLFQVLNEPFSHWKPHRTAGADIKMLFSQDFE